MRSSHSKRERIVNSPVNFNKQEEEPKLWCCRYALFTFHTIRLSNYVFPHYSKQKLWLRFTDGVSQRWADNIAPEIRISWTTIRHAVIAIGGYRIGSCRIPVGVNRNGHGTLPKPSSFATCIRQGSPKGCFCNSANQKFQKLIYDVRYLRIWL